MGSMAKNDVEACVAESNKHIFWTTVATTNITKQLKVHETSLIVDTSAAAGTVYLPHVAECAGLTYTILLRTAGNNLVIKDTPAAAAEAENWSSITLNANDEYAVLRSDGQKWAVVDSATSL